MTKNLYLITRADLSLGAQLAQIAHSATEFMAQNPSASRYWRHKSNSLVVLAVPDLAALDSLIDRAFDAGIYPVVFRESDMADEITAIALEPSDRARRLCSNIPLAGTRIDLDANAEAVKRERDLLNMH